MASTPVPEKKNKAQRGVALFMVLSAVGVLALLVTEFTYIAQISQQMAHDRLDQLQAFYQAKSAMKVSLLRLKAFKYAKDFLKNNSAGLPSISNQMLDQIWSFPFIFPLPTTIPGLTGSQKDQINAFQKESGLEGNFSAIIESESSRYNLNSLLAKFAPKKDQKGKEQDKPKGNEEDDKSDKSEKPDTSAKPSGGQTEEFNSDAARNSLSDLLFQTLNNKFQADEDFAGEYRDFKLEELVNNIIGWADKTYEVDTPSMRDSPIPFKKAPFYSITELHMIAPMDDKIYDLFQPVLTVSSTGGINVNTIAEDMLKALVPNLTEEEVDAFFKFRDSKEEDNHFKKADDFFNYLKEKVGYYSNKEDELENFKKKLDERNIRIITDENEFRITVRSQVNQANKLLEACVSLGSGQTKQGADPNETKKADPGLKITCLRVL